MRARSSLLIPAALGLAALSLASSARAQVVTFSNSGSAGALAKTSSVTLSDEIIRAMLALHESTTLQPNAENNYVVLVVDANDQYVSSRASKMNVITSNGDGGAYAFTAGDSGAAHVMVRKMTEGAAAAGAAAGAAGTVVMTRTSDHGDGGSAMGVMGTGVNMSDVASIGMKRFAAGELASGQLVVSVIKLK